MSIVYLGKATPASGQGGGGSVDAVWGAITGTLSDQTDLQTALNAKQNTLTAGSNITISNGTISATDTTYSAFGGATSSVAGSAGLVPAPTTGDVDKYLKGDGTWATVSGGSGIQNTATGTDSLTILGTAATNDYCINIGINSTAVTKWYEGSLAIGINAYASDGSVAIGTYNDEGSYYAEAYNGSVAIGINAKAGRSTTSYGAIAIGEAHAEYNNAIAIGCSCGGTPTIAEAAGAIQIGNGRNNTPNSLFVGFYDTINQEAFGNYQLLDGTTGKIPNDRINGVSGSFTSQDGKTVTVTNGVITSIVVGGNVNLTFTVDDAAEVRDLVVNGTTYTDKEFYDDAITLQFPSGTSITWSITLETLTPNPAQGNLTLTSDTTVQIQFIK